MIDKEGSRNVSLGPYRSTELALEERLGKKELSNVCEKLHEHDAMFSKEDDLVKIENMLSVLGFTQESEGLYVRNCGNEFFYFSKDKDNVLVFSGNYNHLEDVIADIDTVNDILAFKQRWGTESKFHRLTMAFTPLAPYGVMLALSFFEKSGLPPASDLLFSFIIGYFVAKVVTFSNYHGFLPEKVERLSSNASGYSFGNDSYEKINSEFVKKALSNESLNPLKLESSQIAQLPEKKESTSVSEAARKYFELPDSERGVKTSPAFQGPSKIGGGD